MRKKRLDFKTLIINICIKNNFNNINKNNYEHFN